MPLALGPTYEEMLHPRTIVPEIRARAIAAAGRDPLDIFNVYNISWRDTDDRIRYELLPAELTGVDAPIAVLCGKDFPSGSHKVGAAYAVLAEAQLSGEVDLNRHTIVWPSTGNYGIGGAWVGGRLGAKSIVVLPQTVSAERFDLLRHYGAHIVTTPGVESNVKETAAKTRELLRDPNIRILNQFEAMGNYRFHYYVTGNTVIELAAELAAQGVGAGRVAAFCSAMGSGGTIAAGDRLKQVFPDLKIVGLEPMQCSTLYNNGYGVHDIQGIGDQHVTWIHNVLNMDAIMCIDEMACKKGLQLLTEEAGWRVLIDRYGLAETQVGRLAALFGVSGVCNVLGAIKAVRHYCLGRNDLVVTVATDGLDRYRSVMATLTRTCGPMDETEAAIRLESIFHGVRTDWIRDGTPLVRRQWHNLKYFTWVEVLGKTVAELDAQLDPEWWQRHQQRVGEIDALIREARVWPS